MRYPYFLEKNASITFSVGLVGIIYSNYTTIQAMVVLKSENCSSLELSCFCAGIPKLHSCSGYFPRTPWCHPMGFCETHHISFSCWWCFSLLWEDIISIVFHYTGGINVMYVKKSQGSFIKILNCPFFSLIQKVRHNKQLVDLKAFKDGLSSLLIPSQKVMFSQHVYAFWTILSFFWLVTMDKYGCLFGTYSPRFLLYL